MTRIVVGVDGSEGAAQALRWALGEAQLRCWSLTAVMAWDLLDQKWANGGERFDPKYHKADAVAALDAYLERAVGPSPAVEIERRVINDHPAPALLETSAEASLLVVGARGLGGFRGLLLGSVSQHCLHHTSCPIAIVRAVGGTREAGRVVVGVDGSDHAAKALQWAVEEACLRSASLDVVHSWRIPLVDGYMGMVGLFDPAVFEEAGRAAVDAAIEGVDTSGLTRPVNRVVASSAAARALLDAAAGADLVVVGARGHGGFVGLLLGSVSNQVAHHSPCTVVVVRTSR